MLGSSRSAPCRAAALLVALAATGPAAAVTAPCGVDDATHWCVDETAIGAGTPGADHRLGAALAFGDFDGDGDDDLAIGVPGAVNSAGVVHVFYSNGLALGSSGRQSLSQETLGGSADGGQEAGDIFGAALAAGDFDQDGFDDLAIGSPHEALLETSPADCPGVTCVDAGGIHVVRGSTGGLDPASSTFFHAGQLTATFGDGPRESDRLGSSLVVGELSPTADGIEDLAAGAPFHFAGAPGRQGRIYIALGSPSGLNGGEGGYTLGAAGIAPPCDAGFRQLGATLARARFEPDFNDELLAAAPACSLGGTLAAGAVFSYGPPQIGNAPTLALAQTDFGVSNATSDHFGAALAVGDFDGDGNDDLAIGTPDRDHGSGSPSNSGLVYVAYATSDGSGPDPGASPDLVEEQEWAGQTPQANDNFGFAIAAGRVDRDGFADLLIGAPGQGADGGFLYLKKGSASGLTTAGNQVISQGFIGGVTEAGDRFGEVLALGDIDGDGVLEVAIGVPHEEVAGAARSGMVYVTRFFDSAWIFGDGWERGDASAWSASVP